MKAIDRRAFYQTRFEVLPANSREVVTPRAIAVLHSWVAGKERRHGLSCLADALCGDGVDLHDGYPDQVPRR